MIAPSRSTRSLALATLGYAGLVVALVAIAAGEVSDVLAKQAAVAQAQDLLDRIEGRKPPRAGAAGVAAQGSPFLEGPTVTVAGAALAERLAAAAGRAGGRIASSRVELGASPLGPGFIAVAATIDIAQEDLQNLLYDIEAGQPFLFVDPLVVQAQGGMAAEADSVEIAEGRMQVTLTVHGRWQGAR